jgi:hypothetical protein
VLVHLLNAVRAFAPEAGQRFRDLDVATLQRSVPQGAFIAPHLSGWSDAFGKPFELSRFVAGLLAHVIENDRSLWLLAASIMIIADDVGCAEQTAETLLAEANALVLEKA